MKREHARFVLGVTVKATSDELRQAFRKAAFKYHPDKYKEPDAVERFREVQEAFTLLSSPEPVIPANTIPKVNFSSFFHRPPVDVNSDSFKQVKGIATLFFGKEAVKKVENGIITASGITEQSMREAFDLLGVEYDFEDTSHGKKDRSRK